MARATSLERENLEAHVDLCEQRYNNLELRLSKIEAKVEHVHADITHGNKSMVKVIIGATGTIKGDIEFGNNLRTENGADIDGYIKKTNSSKSKLTGDFLFKKKDKKEVPETEDRPEVVNKEAIA